MCSRRGCGRALEIEIGTQTTRLEDLAERTTETASEVRIVFFTSLTYFTRLELEHRHTSIDVFEVFLSSLALSLDEQSSFDTLR